MSYEPSIPNAADIIATSQGQLKINFQQLNSVYGTSGDHFAFDNATSAEQNRHAKVTMPQLPSANAPGNPVPTPVAAEGVMYVKSAVSQSIPYYRKDSSAVDFPVLPIRAMGRFNSTTGADIGTPFNLTVSAGAGTATQTLSFTESMPDTNYLILVSIGATTANSNNVITYRSNTIMTGSFQLLFDPPALGAEYSVAVLHYA